MQLAIRPAYRRLLNFADPVTRRALELLETVVKKRGDLPGEATAAAKELASKTAYFIEGADQAGLVLQASVLENGQTDRTGIVEQVRRLAAVLKQTFEGGLKRLSLDKGFHSPANQEALTEMTDLLCLPKPGRWQAEEQERAATPEFQKARRQHPGIEFCIQALESGNGLSRRRDRGIVGFRRYVALAILGRNLPTWGRLMIAREAPDAPAAFSKRKRRTA